MVARNLLFMNSDQGYVEGLSSTGTDTALLPATTFAGDVNLGDNKITQLAPPTTEADAANKAYVDAVASGLDVHTSVVVKTEDGHALIDDDAFVAAGSGVGKTLTAPTNAATWNTLDTVLLAVNDRVLVSSEGGADATPDSDNGVYYVSALGNDVDTSFTLTRATDADQGVAGELVQGLYVFVTDGTSESTGWTMVTTGTITVDTTAIQFSQFSGAPGLTYDQGLVRVVNSVKVDLDTNADTTGAGAGGGTSGLEFDVDTAAGQLRVAVNTTGAIERAAGGGLKVRVDGSGIIIDGSNQLALGSIPGADEAKRVENTVSTSAVNLAIGDPVYVSAANTLDKADTNTDDKSGVVGVSRTAVTFPAAVELVTCGLVAGVWAGTGVPGTPYYVATGGGLSASLPGGGKRVIQIGRAINTNDLNVLIHDFGKKAA